MPKLLKKYYQFRTYGRTDSNYRISSIFKKIATLCWYSTVQWVEIKFSNFPQFSKKGHAPEFLKVANKRMTFIVNNFLLLLDWFWENRPLETSVNNNFLKCYVFFKVLKFMFSALLDCNNFSDSDAKIMIHRNIFKIR